MNGVSEGRAARSRRLKDVERVGEFSANLTSDGRHEERADLVRHWSYHLTINHCAAIVTGWHCGWWNGSR